MLEVLFATCLASLSPQAPAVAVANAVAIRGETELSVAQAFASAQQRAEQHVRELWQERASQALVQQRPFWLPEVLTREWMRRWLANLPVAEILCLVDREDKERSHEFGNSYQTTLWVAEEPRQVQQGERQLRRELQRMERTTAIRYGGIAAGWVVLAVMIGWLDRLSRGYMTGRLRLLGLGAGILVPAIAFLV